MGTQYLLFVPIPNYGAHLTMGIHTIDQLASIGVPELHSLIGGAAAGRQEAPLPGAPTHGFDSSLMPEQGMPVPAGINIPNDGGVVITARGQPTRIVLEPTDFALMAVEAHADVVGAFDVVPQDARVF